ncbi:MAG TPA: aspartate--tRNA ligase [Anaerolineales bacterium]|nr:aspartate--tRNA ligase [Anaerolineales bacterium]
MYKTHTCGELRAAHAGQQVTLAGWVHRRRDHGGVIFIDLRDRFGLTQIIANPEIAPDAYTALNPARGEWVVRVEGFVRNRPEGLENPKLETGEIELEVHAVTILNESRTPPFLINKDETVDEGRRLKYRYLDLRRESMQTNIILRHRMVKFIRDYLSERGFIEIETPILFKTTPEGARDYLVPSRVHPGEFYALPQSPQQLKQLLMVAGIERYFQIARCFRDEDTRGDRQPEFTQLDLEMSFVDRREDIMDLMEAMYTAMSGELAPDRKLLASPWPRITYKDAMERFGTDRPDLRFGLELADFSDLAPGCGFQVFERAVADGGAVRGFNAKGLGDYTRKQIDELTEFAVQAGARGLATIALTSGGELRSPIAKFLDEATLAEIRTRLAAEDGDLLLFVADASQETVFDVLSRLRLLIGDRLGLRDDSVLGWVWVIDFPFAFWNEAEQRWDPSQHLFTMPMPEDQHLIESDPGRMRGTQYDIVLNGYEVSGGSIRIHDRGLQEKIFDLIGLEPEVAQARFGHMLEAFEYGAPPHGGIASGIDRMAMIFAGAPNIREVIAFPKNQSARDVMADAPSPAEPEQLKELHIRLALPEGK